MCGHLCGGYVDLI
jgi:hypothetical protein